jgi:hypothetical protein
MPSVEVEAIEQLGEEGGQGMEEEVGAMVQYVVGDLNGQLYIELLAGLHQ